MYFLENSSLFENEKSQVLKKIASKYAIIVPISHFPNISPYISLQPHAFSPITNYFHSYSHIEPISSYSLSQQSNSQAIPIFIYIIISICLSPNSISLSLHLYSPISKYISSISHSSS